MTTELKNRISSECVSIEGEYIKLMISPKSGYYCLLDKQSDVWWYSNPYEDRLGTASVIIKNEVREIPLKNFEVDKGDGHINLLFNDRENGIKIKITFEMLKHGRTVEISYTSSREIKVKSIRLLDESLWVSDTGKGCVLVPVRLGLMIMADSGKVFNKRFPTFGYEGCHMEMLGMVNEGSAVLVTWHDPYITAEVNSKLLDENQAKALAKKEPDTKQVISTSLSLRKTADRFRIKFLGEGDHVTVGKAYSEVAAEKGWLVKWDEKLEEYPDGEKLFGAINYKLWSVLSRNLDEEGNEKSVSVNWTFKEAAQVAEHLKHDLELDKVLFIMGGWIHRGYDNQHPDILPAAPECGGDDDLAECSRRVQKLGYTLSFHDNYQDIYTDSPSWDEDLIMKREDGSLALGGFWAGGRAYLTCSREAVGLAQRPQNLPKVKELYNPNSYFIDTTYAAGLYECFDPKHPLSLWDDMIYKSAISDYARELFGNFGSECGREWAIPHADFFEGLTGVSGRYYHNLDVDEIGAVVVPLFEMAYRDCIAMYGKYGYDYSSSAEYVLHHISIGRPMHYHNVPQHLYWKNMSTDELDMPEAGKPDKRYFCRGHNGWSQGMCLFDRYVKNTYEVLSPLNEITSRMKIVDFQFLKDNHEVIKTVFENVPKAMFDRDVTVVVNKSHEPYEYDSSIDGKVVLPAYGFVIECPEFVAFYALEWDGVVYRQPALFTIRSMDGASLPWSSKIKVFHGFGDERIKIKGEIHEIKREEIVY
ncbi:hypothetical protein GF312_10915 [Candidatus Poribacteria bacterium]|nr:hypothetical protein [Candidatus Poribacteria bacterium]